MCVFPCQQLVVCQGLCTTSHCLTGGSHGNTHFACSAFLWGREWCSNSFFMPIIMYEEPFEIYPTPVEPAALSPVSSV